MKTLIFLQLFVLGAFALVKRDGEVAKLQELAKFQDVSTVDECDNRIVRLWEGRTAVDAETNLLVWDRHNIKNDGSGILNKNKPNSYQLTGSLPTKLWCNNANGVDKILKAQYGPTEYGLLVCIDLQVMGDGNMVVETNPVLFTHPGLAFMETDTYNCKDYGSQSFYDGFSVASDRILNPTTVTYKPDDGSNSSNDFDLDLDKKSAAKNTASRTALLKELEKILSRGQK